jgi:hypothetical protein|uniref:Uncharacterized protein n=1 Tax=uncultured marine virus TaxID=186617 RepID=A0A0F7L3G8_9VIRU|nr:hypothetical protein [uncultured marine virus]
MSASKVSRGPRFDVTFKAAATLSTLHEQVYISAEDTVAAVTTHTQIAIGSVLDQSTGGAGSSVLIGLFNPSRIGIARGVIASGAKIGGASTTSGYITAVTNGVTAIGLAISATSVTGELFEFVPIAIPATVT